MEKKSRQKKTTQDKGLVIVPFFCSSFEKEKYAKENYTERGLVMVPFFCSSKSSKNLKKTFKKPLTKGKGYAIILTVGETNGQETKDDLKIEKIFKKFFKNHLTKGSDCDIISKSPQGRHGSIAQLGEHLPYKQRVIGSSPIVPTINGPVVQLVRTLACHARGRGFESHPGRHFGNSPCCMPL